MGITDTQYCLILLNSLPASYEVLASHTTLPPTYQTSRTIPHATVHLGDKSTISQVGDGSVVFNTRPGAPPITLGGVLHIPGVRTRFMSTHVLANKGAEVALTSPVLA